MRISDWSSDVCSSDLTAFWEVANYREAYGLFACTGILFNHESPLRPERFVTRKIVSAACRIASGSNERLTLGKLSIIRDWGWAPAYVEAMWKRSEEHTSELQSLMRRSSAVLCLKKKKNNKQST